DDVKNNNALIWGIDPGQTDIFTAVDSGTSDKKERIRKSSTKEYYHMFGYNLATQKCMNQQQKHQAYFNIISKLPSFKTFDLTDFSKAASDRFKNYQMLFDYYNKDS
ncbi:uncharacterized protein BX663DRAFT_437004, partial [Cokeromyces recurvatus]|uniref:uncharacterized protein n=1 Tax=Cokeromyces recurvatus TaxID=90255 RepID=UPI00221F8315